MQLLFGHDAAVAEWVGDRMGGRFLPGHYAIGVIDGGGVLRAGFVLQVHTETTQELTLYSEGAMTHGVVRSFFRYVFGPAMVHRLQIRTSKKNKAMKKAAPKLGFKFEGVAREFYGPGEDALLFYMTPSSCRWIKRHELAVQIA